MVKAGSGDGVVVMWVVVFVVKAGSGDGVEGMWVVVMGC